MTAVSELDVEPEHMFSHGSILLWRSSEPLLCPPWLLDIAEFFLKKNKTKTKTTPHKTLLSSEVLRSFQAKKIR